MRGPERLRGEKHPAPPRISVRMTSPTTGISWLSPDILRLLDLQRRAPWSLEEVDAAFGQVGGCDDAWLASSTLERRAEQPQPASERPDEQAKPADPPQQHARSKDGHRVQRNDHAPAEEVAGNAFYDPSTQVDGRIYINLPQWSVTMVRLL